MANEKIKITVYKWAGAWGPFKVNIPCGECTLTTDIINDVISNELNGIDVEVETLDWLSVWWKPLFKGGFHAPIVMVDDKVISQGAALNRGVITQKIVEKYVLNSSLKGTIVFGKESCPHCQSSKKLLDKYKVDYEYLDVVKKPRALYEMIPRVKAIIGEKTPVTVPQIWIDGKYIGGADKLKSKLSSN